jgi:hypothetical protein
MTLPLSDEETARRKRAFVYANQDGGEKGAVKRAAAALGLDRPTFSKWLGKQRKDHPPKPRIRVKAISQPQPVVDYTQAPLRITDSLLVEGKTLRVMAIGDPHDKPGRDKRRFTWMGRHAAETRPDVIVSIGDWASLDSLSSHEVPGSQADADRPCFHQELDSLDESASVFSRECPIGAIRFVHCHGNHEYRAWRAANRQPKLNGDMPTRLNQTFARYRIETHDFGVFVDIGGVDFVHIPLSIMGKEMGGEMMERNAGMKSLRDLVCGHTHRANVLTVMKVGQQRQVKVVNLGTSMPYGLVEKYTGLAPTGWFYGIHELTIRSGQISAVRQWDMLELENLYGD